MMRTWQGRTSVATEQDALLCAYAELFDKLERKLFAALRAGCSINELKREFIKEFGITARQFNALHIGLKGKIKSIEERRQGLIAETKQRIEKAEKVIAKMLRENGDLNKIHQKKRRLKSLRQKLAALEADEKNNAVRICFGSKKLFHAQFNLEENGYADHQEWLADWRNARATSFMVVGSQDETAGNQSCQAEYLGGNTFSLKLRLPNMIGRYLNLELKLPHGSEHIIEALAASHVVKTTTQTGKQIRKRMGSAITYRFLRGEKGWRVFVSTDLPEHQCVSNRQAGAVGVDINSDHLAVTELDRYGNIVKTVHISMPIIGKTKDQALAMVGNAVKQVFLSSTKPLVIEKLEFAKKKASLEGKSSGHNRKISAFAYSRIIQTIKARAFDGGIEVLEVNPAYTSVIGRYKFAKRYGISNHLAAAGAIARRGMNLSEKPNPSMKGQVAFPLPVRNRRKHVWSFWGAVARTEVALTARSRSAKHRFSKARLQPFDEPLPGLAGETPARESSAKLFG